MHELVARGAGPSTPAMAVENGTTEHERRVFSPMHLLPDAVKSAELRSPTLVVIGEVVSLPKEWRARDESWTEVGKKSARRWPHTHADAAQLGAEAATTASVVGGSRRGSTRTRSVVDTRRVPVPGSSTASEWMYTSVIVTHLLLVMTGEYFTVVVFYCVATSYTLTVYRMNNVLFNYVCVVPIYIWFVYDDIHTPYTPHIYTPYVLLLLLPNTHSSCGRNSVLNNCRLHAQLAQFVILPGIVLEKR
ncbi:uroporphyrinogen-III C-methyltransferase [Pseudoscourfieldia marina]